MCNYDCFNCPYDDCISDGIRKEEIEKSRELDSLANYQNAPDWVIAQRERVRKYSKTEKGKATQTRYRKSSKGQDAIRRYESSDKCKDAKKRYYQSEKGKAARKRYLESPKGQEMLKRKYERRKMKMLLLKEGV